MNPKDLQDNDSQARMKRGMEMFQSGATVSENEDGSFTVPSQTSANKFYEVRVISGHFVCTCPDFEYRCKETCKHIELVKFCVGIHYINNQPTPKVFAEDAIPCNQCGSIRVIRYGQSAGKQVFKCKDCTHKFREPSILKHARFTPELVTLTLDLYFSGLSLRKITHTISNHFNIDVNYATIYRWIQKYVPMISEYVNKLAPQLSKEWHADELVVKMKGGAVQGKGAGMGFVWNVMDRETRFLIVSKLTANRDVESTIAAFREAAANAHGITPELMHTDSLRHYGGGNKTVFPNAEHIKNCGITKRQNNNRIERMNGTLRERVKVQRGWKTVKTVLAEGNRIQYNFVKPHMALDGQTPAQVAGININGWKELLKQSLSQK